MLAGPDRVDQLQQRRLDRLQYLAIAEVDQIALGHDDDHRGGNLPACVQGPQHVTAEAAERPGRPRAGHQLRAVGEHDDRVAVQQVAVELGDIDGIRGPVAGRPAAVISPAEREHLGAVVAQRQVVGGATVRDRRVDAAPYTLRVLQQLLVLLGALGPDLETGDPLAHLRVHER